MSSPISNNAARREARKRAKAAAAKRRRDVESEKYVARLKRTDSWNPEDILRKHGLWE